MSSPDPALLGIAAELLPDSPLAGARQHQGQFHDVITVPGVAAVRVARGAASAAELPRRTELLARLAELDLPFEIPIPLGPVTTVSGRTAVAVSWIDGAMHPKGSGDPATLRSLLKSLASVDVTRLADVLDEPHAYAGRDRWADLLLDDVVPRLPARLRAKARRSVQAALDLEAVTPSLVHGDLAGGNMHWSAGGELIGILDWDLAHAFDPALDAACLAWHGWDTVRRAVGGETYRRARVWAGTFGIEQVAAAIAAGDPPEVIERHVASAARWLDRAADA